MTTSEALLLLGLLASASAAPWPSNVPQCARECSVAGSPKLNYRPENTYSYAYTGYSEIQMKGVEGGVSKMDWNAEVDLTWLTPCDMAITFKNPSFGGSSASPEAERFLTQYPMVVAMTDGRVQHVCSHPQDDVWSINLKKGVAAALQNTLPSNSTINSGLNITETGINGRCPTKYMVEHQGDKIIVEKRKDLRFCQERFTTQFEVPRAWHKAPLPMVESKAKCKQEITRGIYTSITCEDKHIIKPTFGSYKYVEAIQVSRLHFQSESQQSPAAISNLQGRLLSRSLKFDHETLKKDPRKVPEMEQLWKEVCQKTENGVERETAYLVDKAIHAMRRVPEEAMEQMMQKIRSGEICSKKERIESLFMDSIAFIQEPNSVKLMVQEIVSNRFHGGRSALYVAALYLTPRPDLQAIEALKPLFENSERHPMAALAAATLVNTYCKHHPQCRTEAPVRQAAEILSRKVQQQCSPSAGEQSMKEALATLKALGNMGVMPTEVAQPVIRCMATKGVWENVRVAAAEAFRNARCYKENTKELVRLAVNREMDSEVRIASYLAAVKCAKEEDLQELISNISPEENTQVRGFILSHLLNLQESHAPRKEELRYLLSSFSIPANFSRDIRKYSRNLDLSYYAPSLGLGGDLESNIIYAPGSFIPRSLSFNLSSEFGKTPVNLGEFGIRAEGLDPLLKQLFGPEGYFQKSSMSKIMEDITRFAEEKGANIIEHWKNHMRERRSIDMSTISHFLGKIYGESHMKVPKLDLYARMSSQEFAFASLAGSLHSIDIDRVTEAFFDMMEELLHKFSGTEADTARTMHMDFDFVLPSTQGIPLKMKLDGTVVAGLKMESRLNSMNSLIKMRPSVSVQVNGFIGFDSFLAKCGLKSENMIASNSGVSMKMKREEGVEIEVELPNKMDIIDIRSETFLMKALKGQHEQKIVPSGVRPERLQRRDCLRTLEEKTGLKLCFDMNLPNIIRSEGLPLGPPIMAKVILEKSDPSMRGFKLKTRVQNRNDVKHVKVEVEASGSSTPRKAEAVMSYITEGETTKLSAAIATESAGGFKIEMEKKWSEAEKQIEWKIFSSASLNFAPENEIIQAKFMSRSNGMTSEILILSQTKNALKRYVDHLFEVRGEVGFCQRTGIPYPRRLEKFEFRTITEYYKMIAFVQKSSEAEYRSVVKMGTRQSTWLDIEATHILEGSWEEGMKFKSMATAKMSRYQYKTAFDLYQSREKIGSILQIVRLDENVKIVDFESFVEWQGQSPKLKFQLDIPLYMRAVKFESNLQEQGNHQYQLQAALKHGHRVILEVQGPVTAKFTREIKQLHADVRVSSMESEPQRISCTFISARNKQVIGVEWKEQERQESLFAVEWNMSAENEHETKTEFKFILPNMMENKINAIVSPRHMQVSFNTLVSPNTSGKRRIKGFTDIDFASKKVKADLYWDADRDKEKKFTTEMTIMSTISNPQHTTIQGGWNYVGSQCHYKTEITRSDPESWIFGRNEVKFELSTPSQRTYSVETVLQAEKQSSGAKVDAEIKYKTPDSRERQLKWDLSLERLGRPFNFDIKTKVDMTSHEGQQSSLILEAKHEKSSQQRDIYVQIHLRSPVLNKPIETSFNMLKQQSSFKVDWKIDVESPSEGALVDLIITPEGGVQNFKVGWNMREIVALLKACYKLAGMQYTSGYENEGNRQSYSYEYGSEGRRHREEWNPRSSDESRTGRYESSGDRWNEQYGYRTRQSPNEDQRESSAYRQWNSEDRNSNEEGYYDPSRGHAMRESVRSSSENVDLYEEHGRHNNRGEWSSYSSGENRPRSSETMSYTKEGSQSPDSWIESGRSPGERMSPSSVDYRPRSSESMKFNEEGEYSPDRWQKSQSPSEHAGRSSENMIYDGGESNSQYYKQRSSENMYSNDRGSYSPQSVQMDAQSSGEGMDRSWESKSTYNMQDRHDNSGTWGSESYRANRPYRTENLRQEPRMSSRRYSSRDNSEADSENMEYYNQDNCCDSNHQNECCRNSNGGECCGKSWRKNSPENQDSSEVRNSYVMEDARNRRIAHEYENSQDYQSSPNYISKSRWQHRSGSRGNDFEYFVLYEQPRHHSHKILIKTPSRTMEGDIKFSPTEYSVRFYPKKHLSEEKYELAFKKSEGSQNWGEETTYEGRMDHPSMVREKKFEVLITKNEETFQGSIILDIFARPEDKITGQLESTIMSRNSIRMEAKLAGRPLRSHPKLILSAAYDSHTFGFDLQFEKEHQARPSLVISAKYDRITEMNAAMGLIVKTEGGPVVEISAAMKPDYEGDCSGVKISALAHSALTGKYDIYTKLCKPGYVKLYVKKHGQDKAYITRFGLEEIKNLEVSLTEKDVRTQEYKFLALARLRLMSPTVVNIEGKLESEQAYGVWNIFTSKVSELSSATMNWMDSFFQGILKEGGNNSPSEEIARLWRETIEEAKRIYEDLVYDRLIVSYEAMERLMRDEFVRTTVGALQSLWHKVHEVHMKIHEWIPRMVSSLKYQFETLTRVTNGVVYGGIQWMKTGEMPEEMRRLFDMMIESSLLHRLMRSSEELLQEYPEVYEMLIQILEKMKITLVRDLEMVREDLMAMPRVEEMVNWLLKHLRLDEMLIHRVELLINKIVQESLLSSVKLTHGRLEIQIPLRRPVNSLIEALKYIEPNPIPVPANVLRLYETLTLRMVDYWIWSYYSFLPKHARYLVPPYNRTAMLVDGKEILTFDRSVLRAPVSPCKILLAAYKSNEVIMEHPRSSEVPEILMKTRWGNFVIKSDFKVVIDGSEMSSNYQKKGSVEIWKSDYKIKIVTPWMIVRAYPKNNVISVEMNGWTFGEVAGLMGTFDGEMGNDWFTSQGTRTTNLQELVRSWQVDQSCQTPSIHPIDAAHTPSLRMLQCQALLGVKSSCNPIVRPDPFMKMCYAARNPCNVAMAYHDMCSSKGVKEVFPLAC